jgi:energy-converting hydrogenase Eha subunit E
MTWRWPRVLMGAQAGYYFLTGVWPLLHLGSFEAVTGPKADDWLVRMVGLLAAVIGATLGMAVVRNHSEAGEIRLLATTSALAFAAIDLWYALSGRISPIYLADVLPQLIFIGAAVVSARRPLIS